MAKEQKLENEWFKQWFGTKYYKLLYRHRDRKEAELFLRKLLKHLKLDKGSRILDVACGNGRHSLYLSDQGYKVTGMDIVPENIETARRGTQGRENVRFLVHDMRQPFPVADFDLVLNLFTSFGYFDSPEDNLQTVGNFAQAMKANGCLVIDFLNCHKVASHLRQSEEKEVKGIHFRIKRSVEKGFIVKEIQVEDKGQNHTFYERVECLTLEDFLHFLSAHSLTLAATFGDYHLQPFDPEESERLIILAKK